MSEFKDLCDNLVSDDLISFGNQKDLMLRVVNLKVSEEDVSLALKDQRLFSSLL
jgi:hypothetical protein